MPKRFADQPENSPKQLSLDELVQAIAEEYENTKVNYDGEIVPRNRPKIMKDITLEEHFEGSSFDKLMKELISRFKEEPEPQVKRGAGA